MLTFLFSLAPLMQEIDWEGALANLRTFRGEGNIHLGKNVHYPDAGIFHDALTGIAQYLCIILRINYIPQ